MKTKSLFLSLFICIYLCSCAATPEVKRPVSPEEKQYKKRLVEKKRLKAINNEKEIVWNIEEKVEARCVRVVSGHEIVIDISGEKRRALLLGIYGPELNDPRRTVRELAEEARDVLKKKVGNKDILISFDFGETRKDTGWKIYVFLPEGDFINGDLVLEGYARVKRGIGFRHKKDMLNMESYSKAHQNGFWKKVADRKKKNKGQKKKQ